MLKLAPGALWCCLALPNDCAEKVVPGSFAASYSVEGGFPEIEATAVAVDRGGVVV